MVSILCILVHKIHINLQENLGCLRSNGASSKTNSNEIHAREYYDKDVRGQAEYDQIQYSQQCGSV